MSARGPPAGLPCIINLNTALNKQARLLTAREHGQHPALRFRLNPHVHYSHTRMQPVCNSSLVDCTSPCQPNSFARILKTCDLISRPGIHLRRNHRRALSLGDDLNRTSQSFVGSTPCHSPAKGYLEAIEHVSDSIMRGA